VRLDQKLDQGIVDNQGKGNELSREVQEHKIALWVWREINMGKTQELGTGNCSAEGNAMV
jgi:hypothetical protein